MGGKRDTRGLKARPCSGHLYWKWVSKFKKLILKDNNVEHPSQQVAPDVPKMCQAVGRVGNRCAKYVPRVKCNYYCETGTSEAEGLTIVPV